jgi:Flp pilus assembly protein TadD
MASLCDNSPMTTHRIQKTTGMIAASAALSAAAFGGLVGTARADDLGPTVTTAKSGEAATTTARPGASETATTAAATSKSAAPAATAVDHLALGRAAKEKSDWKTAIAELTLAVAATPKNADAFNLLGYSHRKSGNLPKAFEFYAITLKLDPKHLGALEYQGEAFVESGQLVKAKANLVKLATVCGNKTCEQYVDLSKALTAAAKKTSTTKKK